MRSQKLRDRQKQTAKPVKDGNYRVIIVKCKKESSFYFLMLHLHDLESFLDASSHLYNKLCPLVGQLVGRLVGNAFVK